MATPVAAITADTTGASPAPTATNTTVSAASTPVSPTGNSSADGSLPSAAESQNLRQLREAYENLKRDHEPYSKLGKPDEISSRVTIATKIEQAAIETGTALGYQEQEIREALLNDPEGTIAFLRKQQSESSANQDPVEKLQQMLDKRLKPFEEQQAQEREVKILSEAQGRFNTAFEDGMKSLFKDDAVPEAEKDILYEGTLMLLRRDPEAVKALREGKQSDVAKFLTETKSMLDKYYISRSQRDTKPAPSTGSGQQRNSEAKMDLNDLITGNFPKTGPLSKYA
jgi:hypothetical protein